MKKIIFLCFFISVFTACKQDETSIQQFGWLEGKWVGALGDNQFYEQWQSIEGNSMSGEGGEIKGMDTIFSEKIKIEQRGEELFYIPTVDQNDGPVEFKFTGLKNDSIVFENQTHDFPQRIIYYRLPGDKLYACIDGIMSGQYSRIEFSYVKSK